MEVLARVQTGGQEIHCGVATTARERAAVRAQRFQFPTEKIFHVEVPARFQS